MNKSKFFSTILLLTLFSLVSCVEDEGEAEDSARYRVTFDATWSASSHPTRFPSNPHFSGLVGAVHNDEAELWSRGKAASDGIELMAETGSKTTLLDEVDVLISQGSALSSLSGGGITQSPNQVSLEFVVNKSHPLVSLVSMIAPSPDWFVGVNALSLLEDNEWVDLREVDLRVYDSGTDNGRTFTSGDSDTRPQGVITRLSTSATDSDFLSGLPHVGRFTFERLD